MRDVGFRTLFETVQAGGANAVAHLAGRAIGERNRHDLRQRLCAHFASVGRGLEITEKPLSQHEGLAAPSTGRQAIETLRLVIATFLLRCVGTVAHHGPSFQNF